MTNFSTFFGNSGVEGLVAPSILGPSFSGRAFAAKGDPRLKNKKLEKIKRMKIEILNLNFIILSKQKNDDKVDPYILKI
jgi:hypothetical protein